MMPQINPKQMERMMRQMGIKNTPIDAERVIIETSDKKITITQPQVVMVEMQGNKSFQISGNTQEESAASFTQEDVEMVAQKTSKTEEEARKALQETKGDIAEAILKLS